jgi:hypothetical protein
VVLVDDFIWSIFYQGIPGIPQRKPLILQQKELTFSCSRGGTFNDFRMMIDDIFKLHDVVENQGEQGTLPIACTIVYSRRHVEIYSKLESTSDQGSVMLQNT